MNARPESGKRNEGGKRYGNGKLIAPKKGNGGGRRRGNIQGGITIRIITKVIINPSKV